MPDKLRFTDKLPMEWLSTAMYTKAALWLYKHDTVKNPRVHACSQERFLVLTTEGYSTYGKITKTLIKRYPCVSYVSRTYHARITHVSHMYLTFTFVSPQV